MAGLQSIGAMALALLTTSAVLGQSSTETFHVTTVPNIAGLHEIGTLLRTVADIQQVHWDDARFDITVSGTESQLALAGWLVKQLDTRTPEPAEYAIPGSSDVVNILYLANTPTQAGVNGLATSLRAVTDIRYLFTYSPPHAVVLRTTAAKAPEAAWLAHQLDVSPDDQNRWQPHEYAVAGNPEQIVKVVYLIHQMKQSGLNEMVTAIRTVADMQAIFTRSEPQGIAFRGSVAQAQLGEWLFQQLDAEPDSQMRAQQHEYVLPGVDDGITRVYYLNNANVNDVAVAIRAEAEVRRIFTCTPHRAVAVRGTSDVIAVADRIVKQHDGPAAP